MVLTTSRPLTWIEKRKESVIVRRHNDIVGDIILAPDLSIFQDVLYNERIFNSDVPVVEKNVIS